MSARRRGRKENCRGNPSEGHVGYLPSPSTTLFYIKRKPRTKHQRQRNRRKGGHGVHSHSKIEEVGGASLYKNRFTSDDVACGQKEKTEHNTNGKNNKNRNDLTSRVAFVFPLLFFLARSHCSVQFSRGKKEGKRMRSNAEAPLACLVLLAVRAQACQRTREPATQRRRIRGCCVAPQQHRTRARPDQKCCVGPHAT